jgi:hypothetical protein
MKTRSRRCAIAACGLCIAAGVVCGQTANPPARVPEGEQILFLIDDSGSMTASGFDLQRPFASRWELVQEIFPKWLAKLPHNVPAGVVSVGGNCGVPPNLSIRATLDRTLVGSALLNMQPNGSTKLNQVLAASPTLFQPGVAGAKRIVLLSDGLNTCEPLGSTCELARKLHADYGITIDVVSLVTDPSVEPEFRCVADVSKGSFQSPQTLVDLSQIQIGRVDFWPYVVMILVFFTLSLSARILYRHGVHVWRWSPLKSISGASAFLLFGCLSAYLVLFLFNSWFSMAVGLFAAAGLLAISSHRAENPATTVAADRPWPTNSLGVALVFGVLLSTTSAAGQSLPASCKKVVQGTPRHHHIIALDMSGSVARFIPDMKLLVACYATNYALPGEEISLLAFGTNSRGEVREIRTFAVPPSGSTEVLNGLLDDLALQDVRATRTYFRPLADFLNEFLKGVRLEPVVVVVSDGKSDGFADAASGRVNFREIPFESFGKQGIYSAPGMNGWRVAIQSAASMDLTALFQNPIVERHPKDRSHQTLSSVLQPCLVDPQVYFDPDTEITVVPHWNPFNRIDSGTLTLTISSECVTRLRSFRVQMRRGQKLIELGSISATPIGESARSFRLPISQSPTGVESTEASIQLVLDQGTSSRVVYPQSNSITVVRETPYLREYGLPLTTGALAGVLVLFFAIRTIGHHSTEKKNRPMFVKGLSGYAVAVKPGQRISVGGEGCDVSLPELPPQVVLAYAESINDRNALLLHPEPGFQLRVDGKSVLGTTVYSLGHQLQFTSPEGAAFDLKLFSATERSVGFGSSMFGPDSSTDQLFSSKEVGSSGRAANSNFPI